LETYVEAFIVMKSVGDIFSRQIWIAGRETIEARQAWPAGRISAPVN
jgi:hypothetical protein